MGSDESHFNVSVGSDGQSHKTVSTNHNLFKEKGEPKRYRTEVLPLTSLTPYRWATPAQPSRYWSRHFNLLPAPGRTCTFKVCVQKTAPGRTSTSAS